jgi:succinyl-CoA synthetase beta subunit
LDLYEYQGKELFRASGSRSPRALATTRGRGRQAAEVLGGPVRGQGPGAHRRTREGRRDQARGERPRGGGGGRRRSSGSTSAATSSASCGSERASDIAKEYYLSLTFDRGAKQALYMFTTEGGVDIEQVAAESPDRARPAPRRPAGGIPSLASQAARSTAPG